MAFDYFSQDDEEKKLGAAPKGASGQVLGEESSVVTGNEAAKVGPTSSGQFTNLQSYLDANSKQNFGSEVAGKVGRDVQAAEEGQQAAGSSFRSLVDSGTVKKDQGLIDRVVSDPESVAGISSQPTSNATSMRATPGIPSETKPPQIDLSKREEYSLPKAVAQASEKPQSQSFDDFVKMRDAKYKGPNNLVDTELYQPAYQQTQNALARANATKDEGGRKALLQQEYGAGRGRYDYGSGMQKLDNLLIQNDPTARQAFAGVQDRAAKAGSGFDDLNNQLSQYAKSGNEQTLAARAAARGAVGVDDAGNLLDDSAIKKTYGSVKERYDKEIADRNAELSAISSGFKNNKLDPALAAKLGIKGRQDQGGDRRLYTADPYSYYKAGEAPTLGGMANVQEQARVAALSKLAGVDNTFLPDGSIAKGAAPSRYSFDVAGFDKGVQKAEQDYQRVATPIDFELGLKKKQLAEHERMGTRPGELVGLRNSIAQLDNKMKELRSQYGYDRVLDL